MTSKRHVDKKVRQIKFDTGNGNDSEEYKVETI